MNYEFLSRTFLFQGTSPEETKHMLSCLKATPQSFAKGSTIWQVGDQVKMMFSERHMPAFQGKSCS